MKSTIACARIAAFVAMFLFGASQTSYAVGAYPGPITTTQPDGSQITIRIHGDEFFNYITTEDGYIVARAKDGYLYYADYDTGELRVSKNRAGKGFAMGRTKSIPGAVRTKITERNMEMLLGPRPVFTPPTSQTPAKVLPMPVKIAVILVDYPDTPFSISAPNAAFSALMNQSGYSANGGTGSIADYYDDNSMGEYRPQFDVYGPYTLPSGVDSYYDESRWMQHAIDAMIVADPHIDYSQYSTNGSVVDLVLIYYAGYNAAEGGNGVWPHKYSVHNQNLMLDGIRLYTYACTSELRGAYGVSMAGIGTMAHEFGHALGLSDIYVTDYNHKATESWRTLDVMNGGAYNNEGRTPPLLPAYARYELGWITPDIITTSGEHTLAHLNSNKAYLIESDTPDEFFMIEHRGIGAGNKWDNYTQINGLLVFHMDYSNNSLVFKYQQTSAKMMWGVNNPNGAIGHQCANVLEASNSEGKDQPVAAIPFPGSYSNTSLGFNTKPAMYCWSGASTGVEITNIKISGGNASFNVKHGEAPAPFAAIVVPRDGYITNQKLSMQIQNEDKVESKVFKVNGVVVNSNYVFSSPGSYIIVAEIKYTAASGLGTEIITQRINITR